MRWLRAQSEGLIETSDDFDTKCDRSVGLDVVLDATELVAPLVLLLLELALEGFEDFAVDKEGEFETSNAAGAAEIKRAEVLAPTLVTSTREQFETSARAGRGEVEGEEGREDDPREFVRPE